MNLSHEFARQEGPQSRSAHHDTHALPPVFIQEAYWHYNKVKSQDLENDPGVIDFGRGLSDVQSQVLTPVGAIPASRIEDACKAFRNTALDTPADTTPLNANVQDATIYEHREFPGLQIIPGLLPPEAQALFVSRILHKHLADRKHKINLEADYEIEYPPSRLASSTSDTADSSSFFTYAPSSIHLVPKSNPSGSPTSKAAPAKPLNTTQSLSKKLRWLTLGTQYDWPTRSYPPPSSTTSAFPPDIAALVRGLFPHIRPESGVCLLYGAKDYMPVHRDVSEQCATALASFSVGCDGIFIVGREEDEVASEALDGTTKGHANGDANGDAKRGGYVGNDGVQSNGKCRPNAVVAIRVRSGDCVHLDGETRWAWHAMPRTVAGTCPGFLADWPVGTPKCTEDEARRYQAWKGWMGRKRLNVSCRQVWD